MRLVVLPMLGWAGFSGAAVADSATLIKNKYEPFVSTKAGHAEICGIHSLSAVKTPNRHIIYIEISVDKSYVIGKLPFLSIKVTASKLINGKLIQQKIKFASVRVGKYNTKGMRASPSEDGLGYLLVTDMVRSPDLFMNFQHRFPGAWVSISLGRNKGNYTFRLPVLSKGDTSTLKQIAKCNIEAIDARLAAKE